MMLIDIINCRSKEELTMSQFMKAGDPVRIVPFIWKVIALADKWAQQTEWIPEPSDA